MVQWVGHGSRIRFPADCGGVRKGIRPQMLLCHTSIQVRRPALILEMKKRVTAMFLTECHRVSRLYINVSFQFFFRYYELWSKTSV